MLFVFANTLMDKQIITSASFTALLLMAVGNTMRTVPLGTVKRARLTAIAGRNP